jgi:hypothetical protein
VHDEASKDKRDVPFFISNFSFVILRFIVRLKTESMADEKCEMINGKFSSSLHL